MILVLVATAASVPSVAEMKWQRRVLVVAAPSARDSALAAQRNALRGWQRGAEDRDVQVVEVIGDRVRATPPRPCARNCACPRPASRWC